jgi:hypothetical protein
MSIQAKTGFFIDMSERVIFASNIIVLTLKILKSSPENAPTDYLLAISYPAIGFKA